MGGGLKTPIILHFTDILVSMREEVLSTNIMQNSPVFGVFQFRCLAGATLVEQQYNLIA